MRGRVAVTAISRHFPVYLSICTAAVAQPLLQMYGENLAVFTTANLAGARVLGFMALVVLAPPSSLVSLEVAVSLAVPRWQRGAHLTLVWVASTALAALVLRNAPIGPWAVALGVLAAAGAGIIAATAGDRPLVVGSCAIGDSKGALEIARPALAAEAALRGSDARIVRLPWAYGPSGFICDMSRGLQMRRFRMVGPATNRIALIGARDAARALIAAAAAPPGTYAVAEPDPPTQMELVHHLCAARKAPRPDHLPPRMAGMSMGSVVVDALTADQRVAVVAPDGFVPAQRWERDIAGALRGE